MAGDVFKNLNGEIAQIIAERDIVIQFQQIVRIPNSELFGYEALCRGPSNSVLHSPLVLFEAAENASLLYELEVVVLEAIVRRFADLELPGYLFMNTTAHTLMHIHPRLDRALAILEEIGLANDRIVIELTETHPVFDQEGLEHSIGILKDAGFSLALDDLGEGFASLKRWTIMKPDYVKIDRHFVEGIHKDAIKQQFIRSVIDISRVSGSRVIAEGIEQLADLHCLKNLGVRHGQGYIFNRPDAQPLRTLSPDTSMLLGQAATVHAVGSEGFVSAPADQAGSLCREGVYIRRDDLLQKALNIFQTDSTVHALPVLDDNDAPIGILRAVTFLQTASKPYFHEVYARKACEILMETDPLIFDETTDLRTMSRRVAELPESRLIDGFIVCSRGKYQGTGRMTDLITAISDAQIFAARYANPLTLLPGNVPIDRHMQELLDRNASFVAVYWDINQFKPYNDAYGYSAGDRVISHTAAILKRICDPDRDFVGHIGGDDFVSIFLSEDWERRIQLAISDFETGKELFHDEDHIDNGGYMTLNRQGLEVFHSLLTIAAGVLPVRPGTYRFPGEVARELSALKKLAKRMSSSDYYVDRRVSTAGKPLTQPPSA